METRSDILIIGAGLIGLSIADSLLAAGARVTLFEKQVGPGRGAGQFNSGMVHPSQVWPWQVSGLDQEAAQAAARSVYPLAQLSRQMIAENMRRLGLGDQFRPLGTAQVFAGPEDMAAALARYQALGTDYDSWRVPASMKLTKNAPETGLMFAGDMSGDPWAYCKALADDLRARGAVFIYDCPVELYNEAERAFIVTPRGDYSADHIVVAAGAGSVNLAAKICIKLPIIPVMGHALDLPRPENAALPDIPVMHGPSHSAFTPFEDFIRLSGTVGAASPDALLPIWTQAMPSLKQTAARPIRRWSAARPVSRLGRPIMGPLATGGATKSNLWLACGHGHMGWTLCAGSGAVIADQILTGSSYREFAFMRPN